MDTFKAAVAALYGPDEAARQQADQWLIVFKQNARSWATLQQLLAQDLSAECLFVACSVISYRAAIDWRKMTASECEQMSAAVRYVT